MIILLVVVGLVIAGAFLAGPQLSQGLSSFGSSPKGTQVRTETIKAGDVARKALDDAEQKMQDLESNIAAANHDISNLESSLQAAQAEIVRAEEGLSKTVIKSPMDGVITALNAEVGEVVLMGTMNNPG